MKFEQLSLFDTCACGGACTAECCEGCTCGELDTPEIKDPSEAKFEAPKEVV